jgi:hypothetical protein
MNQPKLPALIQRFLSQHYSTADSSDTDSGASSAMQAFPLFDQKLYLHSSAACTFFAPSDYCGMHGLRREHIRATGSWRGEHARQDVVLVDTGDGGNKSLPMSGYALARVLYLFSFQYAREHFPVALVWWYTLSDDAGCRDEATGMWLVEREYRDDGEPHFAVVPVASFLRAAHLMPFFGQEAVSRDLSHRETLDVYARFYVNRYADHHAFEIL